MDEATQKNLAGKLLPEIQIELVQLKDFLSEKDRVEIQQRSLDIPDFLEIVRQSAWSTNPMLFTMASYVYVRYGEFPQARVKLYARLIEGMIIRRSRNKAKEAIDTQKRILAQLAYRLFQRNIDLEDGDAVAPSGGRVFQGDIVVRLLAKINRDDQDKAQAMMEEIKESGLLEPLSEGRLMFQHQSFHEYLTGVWLADRLSNYNAEIHDPMLKELRALCTQERWSEPLRFMVGELFLTHDSDDREKGREWIADIAHMYEESGHSLVLLQLLIGSLVEIPELDKVEASMVKQQKTLGMQAAVQAWIEELKQIQSTGNDHRKERSDALLRLSALLARFPATVLSDGIRQLMALTQKDDQPDQQEAAAKALGTLHLPDAIQALSDLLERQSASEQVRSAAARGLTQAKTEGLATLEHGLQSTDVTLKRIIARSLGAIEEEGFPLLAFALHDQTDAITRRNAVRSLQEMGQRTPEIYLQEALRDEDAENRSEAIGAVAGVAANYQADDLSKLALLLPNGTERQQALARIIDALVAGRQSARGVELARITTTVPVSGEVLVALAYAQKAAGELDQDILATLRELSKIGGKNQSDQVKKALFPEGRNILPERLRTFGYRVVTGTQSNGEEAEVIIGPMVAIPAGPFLMGSDKKKDSQAFDNELPQFTCTLEEYAIGKYPLTVAEYQAFLEATNREKPDNWRRQLSHPDHPIVYVSWNDMLVYVQWLAQVTDQPYRLPTEAEWEKAARGTDGRIYPWGNEWDKTRANTDDGGPHSTTPVGSYPQGASPYECLDMAGNVWEWTSTIYMKYPYSNDINHENNNSTNSRVLRGGSWNFNPGFARAAYRDDFAPDNFLNNRGGRVARARLSAGS